MARDLILKDKVALIVTAGTPETANPVSEAVLGRGLHLLEWGGKGPFKNEAPGRWPGWAWPSRSH